MYKGRVSPIVQTGRGSGFASSPPNFLGDWPRCGRVWGLRGMAAGPKDSGAGLLGRAGIGFSSRRLAAGPRAVSLWLKMNRGDFIGWICPPGV